MTYTTASNSVSSTLPTLQGTVLAVSPDSNTVVISDPTRQIITLFNNATSSTTSTYTGVGNRAAFTPDGSSVYITTVDNHLLVYSTFSSWQSYDLSATGANDVAIAVPSVGAFVTGTTGINGRSYCANANVTPVVFYPQASATTVAAATSDRAAVTNNGKHLLDVRLAASGGTPVVNDITFPTSTADDGVNGTRTFTGVLPTGDCPESGNPPVFGTAVNTALLTGITSTGVTGIFPASDSSIAFATYLPTAGAPTTGALLPAYTPGATAGTGTVSTVKLANGATAPVAGVFSSDNLFFFAGTSGDNLVHLITRSSLTDTSQLAPQAAKQHQQRRVSRAQPHRAVPTHGRQLGQAMEHKATSPAQAGLFRLANASNHSNSLSSPNGLFIPQRSGGICCSARTRQTAVGSEEDRPRCTG